MNWGITAESARNRLKNGYLRAGQRKAHEPQTFVISYLTSGIIDDLESGNVRVDLAKGGQFLSERKKSGGLSVSWLAGKSVSGSGILYDLHSIRAHCTA